MEEIYYENDTADKNFMYSLLNMKLARNADGSKKETDDDSLKGYDMKGMENDEQERLKAEARRKKELAEMKKE